MAAWFFCFFFLLLIPLVVIFNHQKTQKTKSIHRPPGPPGLPFIGNFHQFDSAKPHEFLSKLSNKYGPLMSLKLGKVRVLVISSAKMAKEALKTHDLTFSGRPPLIVLQKVSYNGLDIVFAPYGEYWREMKKISLLHLFTMKRVQSFRPILDDEVSLLIKEIFDLTSSSQVINLSLMTLNLTSSYICRIAFGKKYDKEDQEKKRFDHLLQETQSIHGDFYFSDYLPSLGWIDKVLGKIARLDKNCRNLDLFYQELIEEHLSSNRPDTMKNDILDLLIQIKEEKISHLDLSWDHIKAVLMNVFIAGSDTSSALIVWAMTALMQSPSIMKRVQAEVRDMVEKKGGKWEEVLQELPYLDAVIKETLRLYPPTPLLLPRETLDYCNIEGFDIEPKTMVFINAWAIARDPTNWQNPTQFIPDRFLNSNVDVKGSDFELIPFGTGRRRCPGISLGLSTTKVTLAKLLYSFNWELPPGMKAEDIDTDGLPGATMHKRIPLCLLAKKYA
ncbi:OLC1v1003074C1 [Oldenlandia corymbosa var. corymbosa]|uniref:OLC1v1003074C1 n=1 Tax=Oldenlandia corymbosa var. corymbosa TaxID=529605 RepID=A0AAV1D969_OLDCO|nr:OLC1v1003074C1 [Oldenlandia corymbosa var. corymbosa]